MKVKTQHEYTLNLLASSDEAKRLAGLESVQTQMWESNGRNLPDDSLLNAIIVLGKNDFSFTVRKEVATLLGYLIDRSDKRVVKPLIELAEDRQWEVRAEALASMDFYLDKRFVNPLIKSLKDKSRKVRYRAIGSIYATAGLSGEKKNFRMDQRIVTEMLKLLSSEDGDSRKRALSILRHSKAKRILPDVVDFLSRCKKLDEGLPAILILGSIKDRLALITLIELLKIERSFRGKVVAVRGLGYLGYKQAIKPLKMIADDEGLDWELREAALVSIIRLGDREIIARLEEEYKRGGFEERGRVVNVAATAATRECQHILKKGLSHSHPVVASNAAHALAKLGDRRALPVLLMELNMDNHLACADAVVSLGILGDRKAVKHLIKIYDKFDGGENLVIDALGKIGGKEAVEFLRKLSQTEMRVIYRDQILKILESMVN